MRIRTALLLAAGALIPAALLTYRLSASDHADTAANVNRIGADMTDVFIFPGANPNNVVVAIDAHGLIPAGQTASFDTGVLYQMKFDVTGDYVEDMVMQFRFVGTGSNQQVVVSGPSRPGMTGTASVFGRPYATTGRLNQAFSPVSGMQVFAGVRSDPFFFDLNRFYAILPDRMTPLTGSQVDFASIMAANTPQVNGFRGFPAGSGYDTTPAMDYLANLNVLSIVVEMPRAALGGGKVNLWATTSLPMNGSPNVYAQQDRLARPAINEALATVTASRHAVNNTDNPTDDPNQLKSDILSFMNFPAGRSPAIANVVAAVLVPDVLTADLSKSGPAAYLGVETGGATGGLFGGRKLSDDVVDIDLSAVFGGVVPALGLAPDDGKELPQFSTDNVGPHTDYLSVFPYLGNPH
jgi:hypothetical protein